MSKNLFHGMNDKTGRKMSAWSSGVNHELTSGQKLLAERVGLDFRPNPIVNDLLRDIYLSVFKARPVFKGTPPLNREVNRQLIEKMMSNPTWKKSVMNLSGRMISSTVAAEEMLVKILEDPETKEMLDQLSQAESLDQQASQQEQQESKGSGKGKGKGKNKGSNPGSGNGDGEQEEQGSNPQQGNNGKSPEQKRNEAQQIRDKVQQKLDKSNSNVGSQMKIGNALNHGKKKGEDVSSFMSSLGIGEDAANTLSKEDIQKILALLNQGSIGLLADIIGRSFGQSLEVMRGRTEAKMIIDTAGDTQEFDHIFIDEQAMLSTLVPQVIRNEKFVELARRGLAGMTTVTQSVRQGIKLFYMDESGSMGAEVDLGAKRRNEAVKPTRGLVARGFILGLMRASKETGQRSCSTGFGSSGMLTETINTDSTLSEILDWVAFDLDSSSTDFDTSVNHACDTIMEMPEAERYQADITFITDGQSYIGSEEQSRLQDMKRRYGTRLYVITIGGASSGNIEKIADYLFEFKTLDDAIERMATLLFVPVENNAQKEQYQY